MTGGNENLQEKPTGFFVGIVETFLKGHASILFIFFAVCVGIGSVLLTPREEEPQIVVPMADIYIQYPGASSKEVENLVSTQLEKLLWQIDGVEYVYSVSRKDFAIVTVRFFVKEDRERSLVKLYNKIESNIDSVAPGITGWLIKPVEIDDVPIVTFHLYSDQLDSAKLRHLATEAANRIAEVEDISRILVNGGEKREIRVEMDLEKLAANDLSFMEVYESLKAADASLSVGDISIQNRVYSLKSGPFFRNVEEVRNIVLAVRDHKTVRLRDVAAVEDSAREVSTYTRIGFGPASENFQKDGKTWPAVAIAVSKKKGSNAVEVASNVIERMKNLQKEVLPQNVSVEVTRDYGISADKKVSDLLSSLFFSVLGVVALIAFTLGLREGLVVALAVPISFALSLFVNYISGYTINRVTLFALILSLGLVVDDPITNVDNIQRHIFKGKRNPFLATLDAVAEVLSPVLMSTLAIIVSFLPMFFITGMMGPYMEPMAINVPMTVTFSTVCALTFVPWASYHLLKNRKPESVSQNKESLIALVYRPLLASLLDSSVKRGILFAITAGMMVFSGMLIYFRMVPLKMLPFDNKNEFQILVNMPEGTTLEGTDALLRDLEGYLSGVSEITNFQSYAGISSPMDFNGMVRHYYLRQAPHMGDIRVNLLPRERRTAQSHDIVLRLRKDLKQIAKNHGARLEVVEVPPGPPVLATMVAEIYGREDISYEKMIEAASVVEKAMIAEPFLEDVDSTVEDTVHDYLYLVDREKAAIHGLSTEHINQAMRMAVSGIEPATLHLPKERERIAIRCVLPENRKVNFSVLESVKLRSRDGSLVSLGEVGRFEKVAVDQPIYHKNLKRVVYVTGEMAGRAPGEAIIDLLFHFWDHPLPDGIHLDWAGEGEWKITLDVFRDLGLAFGAAMIGIYFLIVLETGSFFMPLLIMLAIPLTAIGVMPGFWILNLIVNQNIGGFQTPVFFTATGMIGMIALGGIVVRNSMVLIEFIEESVRLGLNFREAILQSGVVRFRPIMLTAGTTLLGAWPITLDPVFSGLAWALIFGLAASTLFTVVIVPVVYFMVYKRKYI